MSIITLDKVTLDIIPDLDPEDPREWENLGTMACWHRRYTLGEQHGYADPPAFTAEINQRNAVILPLYLFDHSGLTISTEDHIFRACDPAGWDWGQVGYIYVSKADAKATLGVKRLLPRHRIQIEDILRAEVATYNQYLQGEVYGYILKDRETDTEIDSCWGFYGYDPRENGMAEHFPSEHRAAILQQLAA